MSATAPYPNDALRWTAAEVRYPQLEDLAALLSSNTFRDRIRDRFPIPEEQSQVTLSMGQTGPVAAPTTQHRFVRRDRLMSVTISRDALALEATEYPGWHDFRALFVSVIEALQEVATPDGISRIGLRYVDEIRLPDPPQDLSGWDGWIDARLLAPFQLDDDAPTTGTVVLQYGQPPGYVTVFRASPFPEGRAVQPGGPLRMPVETGSGPFFLFDTDASWADPSREVPEFNSDRIASILDDLHGPCNRLFEASITDRLRDEVLRRERTQS